MFGRRTNSDAGPLADALPQDVVEQNAEGGGELEQLWSPAQARERKSIEQILLERGEITDEQLDQAKKVAAQTPGKTLVQILQTMNAAGETQILAAQAEILGVGFETPHKQDIDIEAFGMLSGDYIRKNFVLPMRFEEKTLVVGMSDPSNVFLYDEVRRKTKRDVKVVAVTTADVNKVLEAESSNEAMERVDEILKDVKDDDVQLVKEESDDGTDLARAGNESPIIRFVNYLIADAIKQGASDIHIEPKEKALKIRYRIDGILFEAMNPPWQMTPAVISRLKIMANLDISERRLPQDGRIRAVVNGNKCDLRMSTL